MMHSDDIHAFGPPPPEPPPVPAAPTRRRRWPWVLAVLGLVLACTLATAMWLGREALHALPPLGSDGWHVVIDGEEVGAFGALGALELGVALAVTVLVVLVVVPLSLLLAGAAVVLSLLLAGLAVAGVAVAGVALLALLLGLVSAPLWLPVLLLVWLLRRPRGRAAGAA
jgi:hypothetical protein